MHRKYSNTNLAITKNFNCIIDLLLPHSSKEADRNSSAKVTKQMHNTFEDVYFSAIGCFNGTFILQNKKKKISPIRYHQDILYMRNLPRKTR